MTARRITSPQVNSLDVHKAKQELKQCPLIIRQYVKCLEDALERQKDLTAKALGELRRLSTQLPKTEL